MKEAGDKEQHADKIEEIIHEPKEKQVGNLNFFVKKIRLKIFKEPCKL